LCAGFGGRYRLPILPEATNFGVVRIKRDILRRSAIGAIYGDRSISTAGDGASRTYGADGLFSFYENLNINTYFARTETPGLSGHDTSYRAQLDYAADRYGVQIERLALDDILEFYNGFRIQFANRATLRMVDAGRQLARARALFDQRESQATGPAISVQTAR